MKLLKKNKGFTLLFAVLVSIIVLAVGASIINIALKQVILSGVGRESQYAFYSANTGVECAIYWDLNHEVFAQNTDQLQADANLAECAGINLFSGGGLNAEQDINDDFIVNKFSLDMRPDYDRCVDVEVKKFLEQGNGVMVVASTSIEARGYNTCDVNSPRRTERGLRITY